MVPPGIPDTAHDRGAADPSRPRKHWPGHWPAWVAYETPRVRAVSRVRRWRIIQAAERARQAIAHGATGCAVVSGVIAASSASKAVSQIANSMIWFRKPRRWRPVRP